MFPTGNAIAVDFDLALDSLVAHPETAALETYTKVKIRLSKNNSLQGEVNKALAATRTKLSLPEGQTIRQTLRQHGHSSQTVASYAPTCLRRHFRQHQEEACTSQTLGHLS